MDLRRLSRQLASESMVYGIAGVLSKFIAIFLIPIYTRIFSPGEYGHLGVVNTTYQLLSAIVVLGLDGATSRWYWETDDDEQRKRVMSTWFFTQLAFSTALTLLTILFARNLAQVFFDSGDKARLFVICVLSLPLATYTVVFSKYLRFRRKPVQSVVYSLAINLVNVGSAIFLVLVVKLGIAGFFVAAAISQAIAAAWAALALRSRISHRRYSAALLREMLKYSVPMMPTIVGAWIINQVSVYFLNFTQSAAEVGLFQIGGTIASLSGLFYSAFQQAWGPFAFSIQKERGSRNMYALTLLLYMGIGGGVAFINGLFGRELLALFTTKAYAASSSTVVILSFGFIAQGILSIAALGCNIAKKNGAIGIGVLVGSAVSVGLNAVLDPVMGKEGAAISFLVAQLAYSGYVFFHARKVYLIPYPYISSYAIFFFLFAAALFGSLSESIAVKMYLLCGVIVLFLILLRVIMNSIKKALKTETMD